ncbi:hypothetical protein D9M71_571120 [compost metagenome]
MRVFLPFGCTAGGGGVVDVPLAIDAVQFRRPDRRGVRPGCRRTPHGDFLGLGQFRQIGGGAYRQAVTVRTHVVENLPFLGDPGIRARIQQRIVLCRIERGGAC